MAQAQEEIAVQPGWPVMLLWLAILIGIPAAIAWRVQPVPGLPSAGSAYRGSTAAALRPPSPPPAVQPMEVLALGRDQARNFNAKIPFSPLPNPAARPFHFLGPPDALARATDCLAVAQYYEAGDDTGGQRAVAQVVLNRLRHPAFPKTVCGVVFQGSERATDCQFTFTCDGALARTPSQAAWERAQDVARDALSGHVYRKVGHATHYHTDWVVPYWSGTLDKVTAVGTHLFFRWMGWWGTPPAFRRTVSSNEPVVRQIARLSAAHQNADGTAPSLVATLPPAAEMAAGPVNPIRLSDIGTRQNGTRLLALEPRTHAFVVALDRSASPDSYPGIARSYCTGLPQCRILAWTDPAQAPKAFPVDPARLSTMSFSYIHDSETGLQRALWNCAETRRATPDECMRDREPAGAPPAPAATPPRPAETVTIRRP